ncbi:MAG: tetratricopeptide repeat protein, partial [Candidatus Poseidoniaceae archaeon]
KPVMTIGYGASTQSMVAALLTDNQEDNGKIGEVIPYHLGENWPQIVDNVQAIAIESEFTFLKTAHPSSIIGTICKRLDIPNYFHQLIAERVIKGYKQSTQSVINGRRNKAVSLGNLGRIANTRGDLAEAERLYRESLAIKREIGNRSGEVTSLNNLGDIATKRGDLAEAERLHRESLAISREIGDRQGEAIALGNLANIAQRDDLDEAERLYRESLAITRESGDRQGEAISLTNLGIISMNKNELQKAENWISSSLELSKSMGSIRSESNALLLLGDIAKKRGDLDLATQYYNQLATLIENNKPHLDYQNSALAERLSVLEGDSQGKFISGADLQGSTTTRMSGAWVNPDGTTVTESAVKRSYNSNITELVANKIPLFFDILGMNFFFDERYLSKLLRMYWTKSANIPQPVNAIILNNFTTKRKKGEDIEPLFDMEYHIIDGKKNLMTLFAAVIEAYRRLDNLESLPDSFNQIYYEDNTDRGTIVDLLSNHQDYGDDVTSFVQNINTILDSVQNQGKLEDFIQSVCEGRIRVFLIKTEKSSCKECGHSEFETREDGSRYCKSCGAMDQDSGFEFN